MSDAAEQQRITIVPHRPYIVSGGVPLTERSIGDERDRTHKSFFGWLLAAKSATRPAISSGVIVLPSR